MNKAQKLEIAQQVNDLENKFNRKKEDIEARRDSSILNWIEEVLLAVNEDSANLTASDYRHWITQMCIYIDNHRYNGGK